MPEDLDLVSLGNMIKVNQSASEKSTQLKLNCRITIRINLVDEFVVEKSVNKK